MCAYIPSRTLNEVLQLIRTITVYMLDYSLHPLHSTPSFPRLLSEWLYYSKNINPPPDVLATKLSPTQPHAGTQS